MYQSVNISSETKTNAVSSPRVVHVLSARGVNDTQSCQVCSRTPHTHPKQRVFIARWVTERETNTHLVLTGILKIGPTFEASASA
jgi:hypothetical protein